MKLNRDATLMLRKILIYFIIIFAVSVVQSSFLAVISPLGAVPDLVLILCLGVGYFCGPLSGAVCGAAAGVVSYALGGVGFAVWPLFYCAVGAAAGYLVRNFFAGKFAVWCIYTVVAAMAKGGCSLACIMLFSAEPQLFLAIWRTVIPEFLGTALLGAILYRPVKWLCGRI